MLTISKETLKKYDVPGPRYTSYPTAPQWKEDVDGSVYEQALRRFGESGKSLSLYLHVPFCDTLCTFCGCHTFIRKKEARLGDDYLSSIEHEMAHVSKIMGKKPRVVQFHIGGGTPNYLSRVQMDRLFSSLEKNFALDRTGEVAIEVDPRTVAPEDIDHYRELGFNRISFGVQDFNPRVQQAVNRLQPYELVAALAKQVRRTHFESLNMDLIYGLPFQTKESFHDTVDRISELRPDRIALYSYAHVPWLKPHQKKIDPATLPSPEEKLDIFLMARDHLHHAGYDAIAMDHFALQTDAMAKAFQQGKLYRNFMGYTLKPAGDFLGLGVSAIGYLSGAFFQNCKKLGQYQRLTGEGNLPVQRGMVLSEDDLMRQWVIHQWMCRFHVDENEFATHFNAPFHSVFNKEMAHLEECREDGLVVYSPGKWAATDLGKLFVRNICMGFDRYLHRQKENTRFSRTV